ncbi:MAG: hypothetical protein QXE81_03705 [Desulfurococcaceae archaeon]
MKVAIIKLTSCSGCILQLNISILTNPFRDAFEIAYLNELGVTENESYDIAFVEGSVSTNTQEELLKALRSKASLIIALGTCAIQGGVQALRTGIDIGIVKSSIYPHPEYIDVYDEPRSITQIVEVDYALPGCPVSDLSISNLLEKLAQGGFPIRLPDNICSQCKSKLLDCLWVSKGIPCLGLVTVNGCGALCPSYDRGCYGCSGLRPHDLDYRKIVGILERIKGLGRSPDTFLNNIRAYGQSAYKLIKGMREG